MQCRSGETRAKVLAVALTVALVGCATGNAKWRQQSQAWGHLIEHQYGDGKCSPPAPYASLRSCLPHDTAYELARDFRSGCREIPIGDDLNDYSSEQMRAVRDFELARDMLRDGEPEFWAIVYLLGVRWGGWWGWHFAEADCGP